jgi:phenylacetate-CoA ligase
MKYYNKLKNTFLLKIIIPITDIIRKTYVHTYLSEISCMQKWSATEIENWQNNKIQALINHFYENTIYYKRLLDDLKIDPKSINSKDALKRIPPITKEIIRKHYSELIPKNIAQIPHQKASTGGTSGDPLKYLLSNKAWSYTTAVKIYSWQTSNYIYGDTFASIGSTSLFSHKPSILHRLYFLIKSSIPISAINMSDAKIEEILLILEKHKVKYLYGYASALYLVAKYMNQKNINIPTIKGCFPTSEILTLEYRIEMEKAFKNVMDGYGARDGGINAYEINKGQYNVGYNSIAEVVNCYEKNTGTLLVTDLFNDAFPFIRYEIGDDVTLLEKDLSNLYNGQVIKNIKGRSSDVMQLENGNVLTGPAFTVLFGKLNVSAFSITKIDTLKLLVEYEPTAAYNSTEEELLKDSLKRQAGADCEIIFKKVPKFEPNKNGKRRYFFT